MRITEFWDSVNNYGAPEDLFKALGSLEARLAFKSGMESFQDGTPITKVPYNHGERAAAWTQGWKVGYFKKYGKVYRSTPSMEPNHPSSDAAAANG